MKNLKTFLVLFLMTLVSNAQVITIDATPLTAVTTESSKMQGSLQHLTFTKINLTIEFINVNAIKMSTIQGYDFYIGTNKIPYTNFAPNYDSANNKYTFDLSVALESYNGPSPSSFRINNGSFDIYGFQFTISNFVNIVDRSKTNIQRAIQTFFDAHIINLKNDIGLKNKNNRLIDENNVIHIFVDAYGKYYGPGVPTASTEKNHYQFHLLLTEEQTKKYNFEAQYTGEYNPQILSILNTANVGALQSGNSNNQIRVLIWDGAIKGPYTDSFKAEIKRFDSDGNNPTSIVNATIRIAKLYHVSLSTGLIATTLKNPQNIEVSELPSGEMTLIADDPNIRGVLTIMATYYPKGRSFLFPPRGGVFDPSRIGIQVGTRIDDKIAENFFLGLSHDFARGGSVSWGAHFGRRNFIPGNEDFEFGSEIYDLEQVEVKKEWNIGFYFGVVIDTRVALELIKSLGGNQ